ncbi:hypothetical protein M405DRAFT_888094 [Rhizopogon salebrosus TDB-379]|nr:hypothetical protein M405DRAFT_888094 [Rhizopogon salebrosus TDB-379]
MLVGYLDPLKSLKLKSKGGIDSDTCALLLTPHIHHTVPAYQLANSQPLLVLFYEQAGELRTALPGGNADEEGESLVWTALQLHEATEVALPLPAHIIYHTLCHDSPALRLRIYWIFDHPVEGVLDPQLLLNNGELLVGEGEDWPYNARELHNTTDVRPEALDGLIYSMHRSRTCASPIKGPTADILLLDVPWILVSRQPKSGDG